MINNNYIFDKRLLITLKARIALLVVVLFSFTGVHAQPAKDTLSEVKVTAPNNDRSKDDRVRVYGPGTKAYSIDKRTLEVYQFQNMANLISQQMPVFVKSYGVNSLATLSLRGASAAQSQVYWNGVPIQNAASGIADVSLLPVSLMNRVNVVYGSSSALWGSGNVGGALLIDNDLADFSDSLDTHFGFSAVTGSFHQYKLAANGGVTTDKLSVDARVFGQSAENGFSYTNRGKEFKLDNARLRNGTALVQAAYKLSDRQTIGLKGWYQGHYREIPPALFESSSVKQQRNKSARFLMEWNRRSDITPYYAKVSYINDEMQYDDSSIFLHTRNITQQLYFEAGLNHIFSTKHRVKVFAPIQNSWMYRQAKDDYKSQTRYALVAAYAGNYLKYKLHIAGQVRGEIVNDNSILLPGLNAKYDLLKWLSFNVSIQRTYRVPTLNELYYSPGGNEQLKPEQGWAQSAGYQAKKYLNKSSLYIEHGISVYNRKIDDWILWFGGAIWTPHNIASVHSRGVETENKLTKRIGKFKLHCVFNAAYNISTTVSSYLPNDGSIGKQIPYTPRYNGQLNVGLTYRSFYINYNHTYTGVRYITTDESFGLDYYDLGNIQAMYNIPFDKGSVAIIAQANNLWDKQYYVVNSRPMPGVNWLLGFNFKYF